MRVASGMSTRTQSSVSRVTEAKDGGCFWLLGEALDCVSLLSTVFVELLNGFATACLLADRSSSSTFLRLSLP